MVINTLVINNRDWILPLKDKIIYSLPKLPDFAISPSLHRFSLWHILVFRRLTYASLQGENLLADVLVEVHKKTHLFSIYTRGRWVEVLI